MKKDNPIGNIKDMNGVTNYRVKPKSFSFHHRKLLTSPDDVPLAQIEHKIFTLHARIHLMDMEGNILVIAKTRSNMIHTKESHIEVYLGSQEKSLSDITISGNITAREFVIRSSQGETLAEARKEVLTLQNHFFGDDTYSLIIAPGVDSALITLLVVAIEAAFQSQKML